MGSECTKFRVYIVLSFVRGSRKNQQIGTHKQMKENMLRLHHVDYDNYHLYVLNILIRSFFYKHMAV